MYKILLIFISLSFNSFAQQGVSSIERDLELFYANCFGPNGEILEKNYVDESFASCADQAKYFRNEIVLYEDNYLADQMAEKSDCVEEVGDDPINDLVGNVGDVTPRVKCSNQEKLDSEKSCGKAWNCNKYRSFITGAEAVFPKFVANSVRKYAKNQVKENNYGPECLGTNKKDCLEEFATSLVGSFWSTATSVWDMVKSGASSIWNMGGWFSKKSDSLQAAAVQNTESVTSFMDSPGKWINDFMDKIKNSVQSWIKGTVFCQEWAGTAHFSECTTPLESLDCIDCDSKMNATCAAIGALTSEFGMMFLTAGVGNIASITAKAGASTMRLVSQNAAKRINSVAPDVGLTVKTTGKTEKSKAGAAVQSVTKAAVGIGKLTAEQIAKLKGQADKLIAAYEKSKIVQVATKVADVVTDPLSITTKAANMGVNASNKLLKAVGTGKVARQAGIGIRVAKRAKTSSRVNDILKKRDNHVTKRAATKGSVASRVYRKTTPKPTPPKPPEVKPPAANRVTSSGNNSGSRFGQRPSSERNNQPSFDPASRSGNDQRRGGNSQNDQFQVSHDGKKGGNGSGSGHEKDKDTSDTVSKAGIRTLGALTAADIANKVLNKDDESGSFPGGGGAFDLPGSSEEVSAAKPADLNSALNMGAGASVSEMSDKADALSEVYSESNRDEIVSRLQETNPGMSRDQANAAFSKRQAQVMAAKEQLAGMQRDLDVRDALKSPSDIIQQGQISELKNKKDNLDKLLANLQNEELPTAPTAQGQVQQNQGTKVVAPSSTRRVAANSPTQVARGGSVGGGLFSAGGLSSSGGLGSSEGSSGGLTAANVPKNEEVNQSTEPEAVEEDPQENTGPVLSMMDMLKLAERDDVDISTDVSFPWEIDKVEALSDKARKSLTEFSELVKDQKMARTKMKYRGDDSHLEVYEFANGKKFSFLIDVNKNIELIPESRTGDIIQRFVKE